MTGLLVAAGPHAARSADRSAIQHTISRGLEWLKAKQGADGGWPSETYGTLRSGVGTTALIVRTLSDHQSEATQAPYSHGITFLTKRRGDQGFVVAPDGASESGMYATALVVMALSQRPIDGKDDDLGAMRSALIAAQHRPAVGIEDSNAGGWAPLSTSQDHVDIELPCNVSATTAVVLALAAKEQIAPDIRKSAIAFLRRCRNAGPATHDDGGFFFTPHVDHPLNKSASMPTPQGRLHPISYFSATCDGLVAMARLNGHVKSPHDTREIHRLMTLPLPLLRTPESLSEKSPPTPIDGLFFYSAAAFADVWQAFPSERTELAQVRQHFLKTISERQHPDGSWTNPVKSMREDDPLIATSLALRALQKLED